MASVAHPDSWLIILQSRKTEASRRLREHLFSKGLKHCCKCKTILDLAKFSKNRSSRDGRNASCRACQSRDYYKALRAQVAHDDLLSRGWWYCETCEQHKRVREFHRKGFEAPSQICKDCTPATEAHRCDQCGETHALTEDYWLRMGNGGWYTTCKLCVDRFAVPRTKYRPSRSDRRRGVTQIIAETLHYETAFKGETV